MKINVLVEGGVGDLILATRFIAAVRDKYPDGHISVFVNNENNEKFNSFIDKHWGYLWNEFHPNVERASKDFKIFSQFGAEVYNGAFENITAEWRKKITDADKWYNFHLDSLKFLEYTDIPWMKYMRHVPTPRNLEPVAPLKPKTVVLNLFARAGHFSGIPKETSDAVISGLRDSNEVLIIAPNEEARDTFYDQHKDIVRVADLSETLSLISQSSLGLSLDSGLRCMFYAFGKGCYTLCKLSNRPFEVPRSHVTRWYMWPEHILPVESKPAYLTTLVENALENSACLLYPDLSAAQIDNLLIKRKYA